MRKLTMVLAVLWALLWLSPVVRAQGRREIPFPDLPGYQTLKCDLHMHTVFSDGQSGRRYAWMRPGGKAWTPLHDGPHRISAAQGRRAHQARPALRVGRRTGQQKKPASAQGAEITRDTPPGHFNALFLKDANPLDTHGFRGSHQTG